MLGGLHAVSQEIKRWRAYAQSIPDEPIRDDALHVLEHKRTHVHGAALFWTLPRRPNRDLLRLLVAYEVIWDFLDNLNERAAHAGVRNGHQLHLAVQEAVDLATPVSDYYLYHPWQNDGGYLRTLVETCRVVCRSLPSYPLVRELISQEAQRACVLAINHHPDPLQRDTQLKEWAAQEYPDDPPAFWWELSGAASAPLTIHALLALATDRDCARSTIAGTYAAYCPWLCATTTMLDSYVDQVEDEQSGNHSYVSHYPDPKHAIRSIRRLIDTSIKEAHALPDGHKHAVIAASMIAMYLSKDAARAPLLRDGTSTFAAAGGSLTTLLLPILRAWRALYGLTAA